MARRPRLVWPTPGGQTGIQKSVGEEVERGGGGADRVEELLAEHPGARPGLLPTGEKTSPLPPGSSRLCGDRDLSLHLEGQHHPVVICLRLNKLAHRTALENLQMKSNIVFFLTDKYTLHPQSSSSVAHIAFANVLAAM